MVSFNRPLVGAIVAFGFLLGTAAHADQQSLKQCQAHAMSSMANSGCYDAEIQPLERRLPPGAATEAWKGQRDKKCTKEGNDEAQGGTAGEGITQACRLKATRTRLHLPA